MIAVASRSLAHIHLVHVSIRFDDDYSGCLDFDYAFAITVHGAASDGHTLAHSCTCSTEWHELIERPQKKPSSTKWTRKVNRITCHLCSCVWYVRSLIRWICGSVCVCVWCECCCIWYPTDDFISFYFHPFFAISFNLQFATAISILLRRTRNPLRLSKYEWPNSDNIFFPFFHFGWPTGRCVSIASDARDKHEVGLCDRWLKMANDNQIR